jgi:hypothetical protein
MVPSLQIFLLTIYICSMRVAYPGHFFILPLPIQSVWNKLRGFLNEKKTQYLSWTPCYDLRSPWAPVLPFHYTGYYPSLPGPDMLCAYKADRREIWSQETETAAWYTYGWKWLVYTLLFIQGGAYSALAMRLVRSEILFLQNNYRDKSLCIFMIEGLYWVGRSEK